jgi:hypothetical protein
MDQQETSKMIRLAHLSKTLAVAFALWSFAPAATLAQSQPPFTEAGSVSAFGVVIALPPGFAETERSPDEVVFSDIDMDRTDVPGTAIMVSVGDEGQLRTMLSEVRSVGTAEEGPVVMLGTLPMQQFVIDAMSPDGRFTGILLSSVDAVEDGDFVRFAILHRNLDAAVADPLRASLLDGLSWTGSLRPAPAPMSAPATMWREIRNATTPAPFEEYLRQYPDGPHAALARNNIARLSGMSR